MSIHDRKLDKYIVNTLSMILEKMRVLDKKMNDMNDKMNYFDDKLNKLLKDDQGREDMVVDGYTSVYHGNYVPCKEEKDMEASHLRSFCDNMWNEEYLHVCAIISTNRITEGRAGHTIIKTIFNQVGKCPDIWYDKTRVKRIENMGAGNRLTINYVPFHIPKEIFDSNETFFQQKYPILVIEDGYSYIFYPEATGREQCDPTHRVTFSVDNDFDITGNRPFFKEISKILYDDDFKIIGFPLKNFESNKKIVSIEVYYLGDSSDEESHTEAVVEKIDEISSHIFDVTIYSV